MIFKKLLVSVICTFVALGALSQNEQIAENNTETTSAKDIILSKFNERMPAMDLYDSWNTSKCHIKIDEIPATYKIDLRDFSMPIKQNYITSNFGPRWGRNHNCIDIKAYLSDTIYAAFSGVVRIVKNDPKGYGNVIIIRHHNGLETIYGHLAKQIVKTNQIVKSGQPIGIAGNTGRSTGTHLHFETRFCGVAINPQEIFSFKHNDVTGDFYIWRKRK
jgi:murein DD-endopeptidase MepM/ murein hydrolase activator NlpD